ncbi:MAG: hypothetical protein ACLRZ7_01760 [Lachnospiraceae bacterium]
MIIFLGFAAVLNLILIGGIFSYLTNGAIAKDAKIWKKDILFSGRYRCYALLNIAMLFIGVPLLFQESLTMAYFGKKILFCIMLILFYDILIVFLELQKKYLNCKKQWVIKIAFILLVSFLLELFAFNYHYYSSMDYKEIDLSQNYVTGNGLKLAGGDYEVLDNGNQTIEILDINEKVNNMYLDLEIVDPIYTKDGSIEVKFSITDEANKLYNRITSRNIVHNVEKTKYLKFNLSGKSEKIKLDLNLDSEKIVRVNAIKINVKEPLSLSIIRFFVLSGSMVLWSVLKKDSGFYRHVYRDSKNQYLVTAGVVFVLMLFFSLFLIWNPTYLNTNISHHKQYQQLARSMLNGQLYLDKEVPESLIQMSNPYDTNYRDEVMDDSGDYAAWDTAYFNGKYYVYFGVVPVVLFYIPYYLATGQDMPNFLAVFLFLIPSIAGVFGLISQIIKRWFSKTPFFVYLMLSVMTTFGGGFLFLITHADLYAIPIAGGLMFTVLGMYCWFKADETKELNKWYLLIGSLCMALVAGCRPQLLLFSFLAIPLFFNHVFKERTLFSKKSIKETICFCLPYIIVAALLMAYNFARFGSVVDFGANYNLTTNDMTKRGFVPGRIGLAIFTYLFQPPNMVARFPFIVGTNFENSYLGVTIRETTFGGIFTTNLILFIVFFVGKFKDILKEKKMYAFTLCTIGIGLTLPIVDAQMAGLLQRYFSDFAFALFLGATILILAVFERKDKYPTSVVIPLFQYGFTLSILYNVLTLFTRGSRTLMEGNPEVYYKIYHAVQFWL